MYEIPNHKRLSLDKLFRIILRYHENILSCTYVINLNQKANITYMEIVSFLQSPKSWNKNIILKYIIRIVHYNI